MSFLSGGSLVTKTPGTLWSGPLSSYGAVPLTGYWAAYSAIYEQQLWVYTVINKRASLLANLPLKVYARTDNNGRDERAGSPLAVLLRSPMPGLSAMEFWVWVASTEDIYGEAFVWKRRDRGGRPVQLVPLHPTAVTRGQDDVGWVYESGKTRMDLADDDVLHFRRYNPSSSRRGLSPLEPLRRTLENEDAARRATSAFWRNGARPGFALSHPGELSESAQLRLRLQFDQLKGGVDNTGSTVVLEEGMKAEKLTLTAEEAQYIESRKLNREEVVAAYDMAPPAVHILDRATFSNITEQFRSVYRDTIGPWAHRFESVIAVQLMPDFDPDGEMYVEFLLDEVLRGAFEARQDALRSATHYTVAEKRRIENLPYIDGTDVLLVNTAEQPLDSLTAAADPAATPREIVEMIQKVYLGVGTVLTMDEARELLNRAGADLSPDGGPVPDALPDNVIPMPVARSVAGRLSWQKTLDEVDPAVLSAGLNGSTSKVLVALAGAKSEGLTVADFRDRIIAMAKE